MCMYIKVWGKTNPVYGVQCTEHHSSLRGGTLLVYKCAYTPWTPVNTTRFQLPAGAHKRCRSFDIRDSAWIIMVLHSAWMEGKVPSLSVCVSECVCKDTAVWLWNRTYEPWKVKSYSLTGAFLKRPLYWMYTFPEIWKVSELGWKSDSSCCRNDHIWFHSGSFEPALLDGC